MATFDPYKQWLGIPAEDQPPNHYRLLGLPLFENDIETIKQAGRDRLEELRKYVLSKDGKTAQKIINEIVRARQCLRKSDKKIAYDTQLGTELGIPLPAQQEILQKSSTQKPLAEPSRGNQNIRIDPPSEQTRQAASAINEPLTSPAAAGPEEAHAVTSPEPIFTSDAVARKAMIAATACGAVLFVVFALGYFLWTYETPTEKVVALLEQADAALEDGEHASARALCADALKIEGAYNHRRVEKLLLRITSDESAQVNPRQGGVDGPAQPNRPVEKSKEIDPLAEALKRFTQAPAEENPQKLPGSPQDKASPNDSAIPTLPLHATLPVAPTKLDRLSATQFTADSAAEYLENLGLTRTPRGWEWAAAIEIESVEQLIEVDPDKLARIQGLARRYTEATNRRKATRDTLRKRLTLFGASSSARRDILSGEYNIDRYLLLGHAWAKNITQSQISKAHFLESKLKEYSREADVLREEMKAQKELYDTLSTVLQSSADQLNSRRRQASTVSVREANSAFGVSGARLVETNLTPADIDRLKARINSMREVIDSAMKAS